MSTFGKELLEAIVQKHPDSFPARKLLDNFHLFEGLHTAIGGKWIHGCGSYLFDGQAYVYNPRCLKKQEEVYRYATTAKKVLEVGVYVGHSLLLMLLANPAIEITAIDIDDTFAKPAIEYLNSVFGEGRIRFLKGDALDTLKNLKTEGATFDLIHIDADHNDTAVTAQTLASFPLAQQDCIFIYDDYDAVRKTVDGFISSGFLTHLKTPDCLWRNCITRYNHQPTDEEILTVAKRFSACSFERLQFNIDAVRRSQDKVGDIVEVGVYKGGSMIAMMKAERDEKRTYWLYDTFEGMTEPSEFDKDYNGYSAERLMSQNPDVKCEAPLADVKRAIEEHTKVPVNRIRYMVGDIRQARTFPDKIVILRLDTDFYDSTAFELEHFYPRVVAGGIVIIDDYGHWQGARKAVDEFLKNHPEIQLNKIDYTGVWFQKPTLPRLNIQYITSLLLPSDHMHRPIEFYIEHFRELADSGVPIGVYLDKRLKDLELEGMGRGNIQILDYVEVERGFEEAQLPEQRNPDKDSADYMWIQLMKLKLVAKASQDSRIKAPALAWIDFGAFYMMKNDKEGVKKFLSSYKLPGETDKILAPGCWQGEGFYNMWGGIVWRFCGTFFVGKKEYFVAAAEEQERLVKSGMPRLTWEVNYWSNMSCFEWIPGSHNETLFKAFQNVS